MECLNGLNLRWCLVSQGVGPRGRQEFELSSGQNVVGRARDTAVNLPHLDVSREHCIVFVFDGTLSLVDSGSRNGTFVNGQKMVARGSITLFENDLVGFGANTSVIEPYNADSPFLIYRVVKKIPSAIFERLAQERQNSVKRKTTDLANGIQAIKRLKSEHENCTNPPPPPQGSAARSVPSKPSTSSDDKATDKVPVGAVNTSAVSCRRTDEFFEIFAVDDDSSNDAPQRPPSNVKPNNECGTLSSTNGETSNAQNNSTMKSINENSTLQGSSVTQVSIHEATSSFQNRSASNSMSQTLSVQKTRPNDSSTGNTSKMPSANRRNEITPGEPKSSKPLDIKIKKELKYDSPTPTTSFIQDPDSKPSEIPTFSLISDDEDDDIFACSQIFVKKDDSQSYVQISSAIDESHIEEEIEEIYDSDEDSFFELHLSQNLSESFRIQEDDQAKCKPVITESDKKSRSKQTADSKKKIKKEKEVSKEVERKEDTKKNKISPKTSKTIEPNQKPFKRKDNKSTPDKDAEAPVKSKPKTRNQHKEAKVAAAEPPKVSKSSGTSKITTSPNKKNTSEVIKKPTTTKTTDIESTVKKIAATVTQKKEATKTAVFTEPHVLAVNKKDTKRLKSASSANKILPRKDVPGPSKRAARTVTFKEQLVEIKEFECDGKMKKLSQVPGHLLKEYPTKTPVVQWNASLLRSCRQISDICHWNIKWLEEFQRIEVEPPLIDYQISPIGNQFSKFGDYFSTMQALIMHELWNELCRIHLLQTETQRFNLYSGVIEHIERNVDNRTLFAQCKILASGDSVPCLPNFGDLIGVQILAPNKEKSPMYDSFGVVTRQHFKERLRPSRDSNFLVNNIAPNGLEGEKVVVCPIDAVFRVSRSHQNVSKGCFVRFRVYKNILNQVKHFLTLRKVIESPLKSLILDPTHCVKSSKLPKVEISFIKGHQSILNDQQQDAVVGIIQSVLHTDSSINLVHGPPGTGKSTTITTLILQLLEHLRKSHRKGPPRKILLCAPSNTAIDELVMKLLDARKRLQECDKFKLTRVGNVKLMHPSVIDVSSLTLARKTLMMTPDVDTLETEIVLLKARIQGARSGLASLASKPTEQQKYRDTLEKLETRLEFYNKTHANIKSGLPNSTPEQNGKLLFHEECAIISGAEIIATTLSSSSSKKLSAALSDSSQFACCIVDEATQATEPEVLLPLLHDIRHMVLVGDPQQLGPTVTSKYAKEKKFDWSLYHRMMNEWQQYTVTPLYSLRCQYRMHIEIATFPSATFYNNELVTPGFLQKDLPFSPFHVISHGWHENSDEESNSKEARFVIDLLKLFFQLEWFKNMTVGIIVPYQSQRSVIVKILQERNDRCYDKVSVNTIDSFQGQEKDAIIFSCVRTKRIGFLSDRHRLNVALTRAKKCLLVVGNFNALKHDEVWGAMLNNAQSRNCILNANPNDRIAPGIIFGKLQKTASTKKS